MGGGLLVKILAVCGMGLGSSLMLRLAVESVLKSEGIDATVEVVDVSTAKGIDADLIMASPEIAEQLEGHKAKVIPIKNLTNKEEIRSKLLEVISK